MNHHVRSAGTKAPRSPESGASVCFLSIFHTTRLDGSTRQRHDQRVQALGTQSCFPMMCSVHAAGWNPKRVTVGLSARISTNACPMSCKNLLIDLYEPNPRSCLMTSRDSIIRANCDLALTWPPIRCVVDEWNCIGLQQVLPAAHANIQALDDWFI